MPNRVPRWTDDRPIIPVSSLGQRSPITEWLVAGPFRLDLPLYREQETGRADGINEDPLGGETTVRPVLGMKHKNPDVPDGVIGWEKLSGSRSYDLRARFPRFDTAVAYAATYLDADEPTDIALYVNAMREHFSSTVQVFLDGREAGRGGEPFVCRLAAGEHCLLLKIAGGAGSRYAWQVDVLGGVFQPIGDGLGVALVNLPGFWRGRAESVQAVVDLVAANLTNQPRTAEGIRARLDAEPTGAPVRRSLAPGEALPLRLEAPLGALAPGSTVRVTVVHARHEVRTNAVIPELPAPGIIHVMEGFHCDPVWVSDQHHYNLVSLENVRQLIDGCLADPNYRVFLHEIDYLKPFTDEYPDYRAALFGLIRRGQVRLGSSYNEPNEGNCSGEAIIRNILYGHGFHRKFLGGDPGVYHAWDVFGHISQLSQIAAKSGLIGILWSKPITGFPPLFRHLALDGTALPMIRTLYGWGTHSLDRLVGSTASLLAEKQSYGIRRHLCVDAGDFTSPSAWMVGHTAEMAHSFPPVVMTGPEDFLHGLTDDGSRLPLTSRSPSQYHLGTTHSRPEMKIANRLGENLLVTAEKWATFASLLGADYPDLALDKAWRLLLFAEHHDALSGTPCDLSYIDLMAGYREALELAHEVAERAMSLIAAHVESADEGVPVVVFNPLNWPRDAVVTVRKPPGSDDVEVRSADGEALPCVADDDEVTFLARAVPSVGYASFTIRTATASSSPARSPGGPLSAEPPQTASLENEYWRITLDPAKGGGVVSLLDKKTGRELIDGAKGVGNDLVALHERGARNGSPWEFWTTGARHHASQWNASVLVETTPLGETATITGSLGDICSYRRTLTLRPGRRTIEASVRISEYDRDDHMFVVTTPLALAGALPVVEDRFGSLATKRNRRKLDYRTNSNTKHSDCVVFPVYNWLEAGWSARVDVGSTSSLNLGLTGLIIPHDDEMEAALEPLMTSLVHAGVTCTPMYDDDDVERRAPLEEQFQEPGREKTKLENTVLSRLDDLNMTNDWFVVSVNRNNRYAENLLDRLPAAVRERVAADEKKQGWSLVVAADDDVPDGWDPVPVVLLSASSPDMLRRAIAQIDEQLAADARIRVPDGADFRPVPEALDDYGFAVLTNGTGAAAIEPDGTLTLMLTKSAPWADVHLRPFVPEHRDMVFHYGFYPHEGCWREAGVVRAGYEFDNAVAAVLPRRSDGGAADPDLRETRLPAVHSFLGFDAEGAVITAIKPAGNPTACFESVASDPRRGITVRAYNSDGKGGGGELSLAGGISEAFSANLMEEKRANLPVEEGVVEWLLGPYAVETVRLMPRRFVTGESASLGGAAKLGRTAEPVGPVYCRYWKHNANVHPIGYLPVGIYLDGELPVEDEGGNFPTVGRIRVTINNNLTDSSLDGTARILAPDRWTVLPSEIPYRLAPREHMTTDVVVAFGQRPHAGLIKARMEFGGQVYQDVLEAGRKTEVKIGGGGSVRRNRMDIVKEREPEWQVFRDGSDIVARVKNPWWEPLDAELVLVTPPEMWGTLSGPYSLAEVGPRHAGLNIPGRQTAYVRFTVSKPLRFWGWMKLMANGKPDYKPVPGTTA